jgi:hypothetical protein
VAKSCAAPAINPAATTAHGMRRRVISRTTAVSASAIATTGTELALAPLDANISSATSTQAPRPIGGTGRSGRRSITSASTAISAISSTQL